MRLIPACALTGRSRQAENQGNAMNAPSEKLSAPVEKIRGYHAELKAIRRDIHAHPELAFQENRTSDLVAGQLASWGIEVHRGLAKTGLVGVVKGRKSSSGR